MTANNSNQFWEWFKDNNEKYLLLNFMNREEKDILLNTFLEQLHNYCDKLYFQIGNLSESNNELIISAEGNKEYFEKVEQLVAEAPTILNWIIIAFKPPRPIDFLEYEGLMINPSELWFRPLINSKNSDLLGLKIGMPNYDADNKIRLLAGLYQILDSILGEKVNGTEVNHVEIINLPPSPKEEGFFELIELPAFIKWRISKRN